MSNLVSAGRRNLLRTLAMATALPAASAERTAQAPSRGLPVPPAPSPALLTLGPPAPVLAPPPAPHTDGAARPRSAPAVVRLLLQLSPVAGFQYHCGASVWPLMRVGDPLDMVREPANRYDARATRLEWQGLKIGYVPAADNAAVSQLLDRDAGLDAVITALQDAPNPWDRVAFAVYLTVTAEAALA